MVIHDHIFNIANAKDIVSLIPGELGDALFAKGEDNWGKFGRSYWFVENEGDIEINPATHDLSVYLPYLRNEYPLKRYKRREDLEAARTDKLTDFRSNFARPPLDLELKNETGEVTASLIDGKAGGDDMLKLLRQMNLKGLDLRLSMDEGRPKLTVTAAETKEDGAKTEENAKWDLKKKARDTITGLNARPCYAYRKDASGLKIVEDEAELVRTIFQMYRDGSGITSIQRYLEQENIPSPNGRRIWPKGTIERLLQNEKYTGKQQAYPAIVSKEQFYEVQQCMKNRKRN